MVKYHMTGMNSDPLNAAHVIDMIHSLLVRYEFGIFFARKKFSSIHVINVWPLVGCNCMSVYIQNFFIVSMIFIPPTKFAGVYSDPYVRSSVRPHL